MAYHCYYPADKQRCFRLLIFVTSQIFHQMNQQAPVRQPYPASKGILIKGKIHHKCIWSTNINHVVKYCHRPLACHLLSAVAINQLVHGIDCTFRTVIVHNHLWLRFASYFFSFTQVHCTHERDNFSLLGAARHSDAF